MEFQNICNEMVAPFLLRHPVYMGKPSSVGQLTRSTQPFILSGSINESDGWRHLVNVYEVKASVVCLQCKSCVIHTWALQKWCILLEALYKCHTFTFTFYLSVSKFPVLHTFAFICSKLDLGHSIECKLTSATPSPEICFALCDPVTKRPKVKTFGLLV